MAGGGLAQKSHPAPAITADAVNGWAAEAKPGETFIYHSGAFLVQSLASVAAARALVARGEALFIQRRTGPGQFDYMIQKRRNAEGRPISCASVEERAPGTTVDEEVEQLMAVLRRLASFGKPCPTNRQLAELAMLKDAESARYRLTQLSIAGRIKVEMPPQGVRVITIVSSGRSTAR
jgi:hypothetical protein